MKLLFAIFFLISQVSCNDSGVAEQDEARRRIIERLSKVQTVLLDDYDLVTRTSATAVYQFRSYRNVAVLFYPIPTDVSDARFTFQAENIHLNTIGSCDPVDVAIHLKFGSYPVVNPDGYPFPQHFIDASTRGVIDLEVASDEGNMTYALPNPRAGEWYAIAYLPWEDPRTQKVEQQGLFADCQTVLYADLQVKREKIDLIDCYSTIHVNISDSRDTFKCITTDTTSKLELRITSNSDNFTAAIVQIQANAIPSKEDNLVQCFFNITNGARIIIQPNPETWHYLVFEPIDNVTNIVECESYADLDGIDNIKDHTVIDLMRENKGMFFSYDLTIPTADLQETLSVVNLTSDEITTLRFKVNPILDIGGTLTIAASMLMGFKYYVGYRRPFRSKNETLLVFSESDPFYKVVVCLDMDHHSVPLENGLCRYNDDTHPALFVLNSTDSNSIDDSLAIPYPEAGGWYLSARVFCDQTVCPCRTDNGSKYYVEADPLKMAGYRLANEGGRLSREGSSACNASVMVSVSSMPCVLGRCGSHGSCVFTTSGGLVMSSCSCTSGYGGWDCSDDSRMDSYKDMMVSILLLTLSNLLFFFSTYVAVVRLYHTEAVMYTFTMLMSTFYHACDAPSRVAYCITTHGLLQFGDFYCGIMSFWVTLLAMSVIGRGLRSVLQLTGAIVVAFLTTWNMYSLLAFMVPVSVGVVVVCASWFVAYRKERCLHFPRMYYVRYLPIGAVLVGVGLVCFGFLQTEMNYKYVHSTWHMIIALSVACLLPDSRRDLSEQSNPFLPTPKFWKVL